MFLETAEKLNTINKTLPVFFGAWPVALILGLILLLSLIIVLVFKNKLILASPKFNGRAVLVALIILAWAPMFFDNIFSAWQTILRPGRALTASVSDKVRARLCAIDQNQNLGNGACSLIPFMKKAISLVPSQAKIAVIADGFHSLFLQYYLLPNYQITGPAEADYWLLYLPAADYQIDDKQELWESRGGVKKNWGRWQVVKIFNQGMAILKKP